MILMVKRRLSAVIMPRYPRISFQQAIPFTVLTLLCLGAALCVHWYFNDQDPDLEEQLFDFSCQKEQANTFAFPANGEDLVADPIFGSVYYEKAPKYAFAADLHQSYGYFDEEEFEREAKKFD